MHITSLTHYPLRPRTDCLNARAAIRRCGSLRRTGGYMKTFRFFTMLTLTLMMITATALVHAPFEFTVANKTMPAGNYTIRSLSPSRLLIRSEDGHEAVIASVFAVQAK